MTDYLCPNCGPHDSGLHHGSDGNPYVGCYGCGEPVDGMTPLVEAYKAIQIEHKILKAKTEHPGKQYTKIQDYVIGNYLYKGQPDNLSNADILIQQHKSLKAENEYLKNLLREPVGELKGALPAVVYFANESDREGFIDAVKEAMPNAIAKKF